MSVEHSGVEIDLGPLTPSESQDLAEHLREAADELDPPDTD